MTQQLITLSLVIWVFIPTTVAHAEPGPAVQWLQDALSTQSFQLQDSVEFLRKNNKTVSNP